jgi:hypothetical protein
MTGPAVDAASIWECDPVAFGHVPLTDAYLGKGHEFSSFDLNGMLVVGELAKSILVVLNRESRALIMKLVDLRDG